MRLLDSSLYTEDLKKALESIDLSNLDGQSFFITGGLGLIASTIVDVLLTYGKTGIIYIGARNIPYDAMKPLKLNIKPNYIIHGAGLANPELYTLMPVETLFSNIDGIHELLCFAKNNPVKRVLYISSSEVYGKKSTDEPFVEDKYGEVDNIRSSYAVAKIASEMVCKAFTSEYEVDTVIVRPGHIFGPSAKKDDKRISSDFTFKASRQQKLEMRSAGLQKRSYCYSIDCAIQILTVLLKGNSGQAYNIGHDEITTIREMAEICSKAGNVELTMLQPTETELKAFNPMNNSALDNTKVKNLGYRDMFSTKNGLIHTIDILKEVNKN